MKFWNERCKGRTAVVIAAALLIVCSSSPLRACLWDQDTLAHEASGIPDVVDVITGRFERNPPLYYKMRLDRVRTVLRRDPSNLDAYDDAGVACDRLGDDNQAIQFMQAKWQELQKTASPQKAEHTYRYHANLGTFYIHRWVRSGAHRDAMADVEQAHNEIAEAIRLNPDAHFGRERYQLMAIDWIRDPGSVGAKSTGNIGFWNPITFLPAQVRELMPTPDSDSAEQLQRLGYGDASTGLAGLIVLGNAWESVDVFNALDQVLRLEKRFKVGALAALRMKELFEHGKQSIFPDLVKIQERIQYNPSSDIHGVESWQWNKLSKLYTQLRENAEEWQRARTDFMMSRLSKGDHPDTDKDFWKGYSPVKRVPESRMANVEWKPTAAFVLMVLMGAGCALAAIAILIRRLFFRKSSANALAS